MHPIPYQPNPEADAETIALLRRVDALRAELRALEPQLNKACIDYGKRRGMSLYREFHLRSELERRAS